MSININICVGTMDNNYEQLDVIQLHILNIITNLISWYNLPIESVKDYYQSQYQTHSAESKDTTESDSDQQVTNDTTNLEVPEVVVCDEPTIDTTVKSKIWIQTRREFRDKLDDGLKICPNYYECHNDECEGFHVKKEFICNHALDNNYCNDIYCTKIIIKKCRKGSKCKDTKCSFRHINREK